MERKHIFSALVAAAVALTAVSLYRSGTGEGVESGGQPLTALQTPKSGEFSVRQIEKLGVKLAVAAPSDDMLMGLVPGIVTLPPEARVAVTAPFAGTIIRLHVIAGQAVTKGQVLAVVRSREPVQFGAELARAKARLGLAQATAARTSQLAREGIIADARADEANAAVRQAQVDVAEGSRVLAQAGASASGETVLRSPITGRVAIIGVQAGGPVDGLTAPFVVENTVALMLDLQIPERLAGSVHPGMGVEVTLPDKTVATGSLVSVGGSIDPANRAVLARARLGSAQGLIAGKTVMVALKGGTTQNGVSAPASALTRIGDKDAVFVRTRTGFAIRPVIVAGKSSDQVFLSSGLNVGEHVAITAITEIKAALGGD